MEEQWRDVPGWEGRYQVSDQGRARSLPHWGELRPGRKYMFPGRTLKGSRITSGHIEIALNDGPRKTTVGLHRLVLLAFEGLPAPGFEACHRNGDPADNRLDNLRWGSKSSNIFDAVRHGSHVQARKTHCPKGHPYDEENTYRAPKGGRQCRRCRADNKRAQRARKASA